MPTTQKPIEELFFADNRTDLTPAFWNRFLREVGVRLRSLDRIKIDWEEVSKQGIEVALDRINEVLLPASERIRAVAELGFLTAVSTTERTLVEGETIQFIIGDEDQRELFTPGPFLAVTRLETPDDYAVGRLMFFNRETGVLDIRIEAVFGDPGPHDDWMFSAVAGAVQAQVQLLELVQEVRGEVEELRGETATDRGLAQAARTEAETAQGLSETARDGAETARDKAQEWATKPEDIPVETGPDEYSALHYAKKAEAAAAAIAQSDAAGISFDPLPSGLDPSVGDVQAGLTEKANRDGGNISDVAFRENLALGRTDILIRPERRAPIFERVSNDAISIRAGTIVEVDGHIYTFHHAEAVTMPALSAGDDIAIWIRPDGQPVATLDHSAPPVAGSRLIGGAHYAPGGNAPAYNSGGDTAPQFNPHSIWDARFRPSCPDPRGMTLVAGQFWVDIYLLGVNHHINGTSKFNVRIADDGDPPKIPDMFGGDGSATYSNANWWTMNEVLAAHGKQSVNYQEFAAAAYGVIEKTAGGTDPVDTILRENWTSIWGLMLATGNMWVWGRDFGRGGNSDSWSNNADGRGDTYALSRVALFGAVWPDGANAGSRASFWGYVPSDSSSVIGARGRSDHLNHE